MVQRRITWLVTALLATLGLLLVRVVVLMLLPDTESARFAAKSHWTSGLRIQSDMEHLRLYRIDDGRGRILFRTGLPWSGTTIPLSETESRRGRTQRFGHGVIPAQAAFLHQELKGAKPPQHQRIPGLRTHTEEQQASPNPVVGKVGLPDEWPSPNRAVEEQGRSGLEYTFDSVLRHGRPGYVGQFKGQGTDWWNARLFALQANPGVDVRTTVDEAWQTAADAALRRHGVVSGAVVVLDVQSRDILAMSSASPSGKFMNQAVKAQVPGSIFKIVTAAAAWDSYRHSPQDRFYCNGTLVRPGLTLHCWRAHGEETLLQAFAGSCDAAFAAMGLEQRTRGLELAANRLGLMSTGLQQVWHRPVLAEAEAGRVFLDGLLGSHAVSHAEFAQRQTVSDGDIAHAAIGQQDVRMSPLQGANLAATVAAKGIYRDARLVQDTEVAGHRKRAFATNPRRRAISAPTAAWIGLAMHMAAHNSVGTAYDLARNPADPAVKTGTAELSGSRTNALQGGSHSSVVNSWMVGFAPYQHPKIAFAVYVGNQDEAIGHRQVHAAVQDLLKAYMQFQPRHVIA